MVALYIIGWLQCDSRCRSWKLEMMMCLHAQLHCRMHGNDITATMQIAISRRCLGESRCNLRAKGGFTFFIANRDKVSREFRLQSQHIFSTGISILNFAHSRRSPCKGNNLTVGSVIFLYAKGSRIQSWRGRHKFSVRSVTWIYPIVFISDAIRSSAHGSVRTVRSPSFAGGFSLVSHISGWSLPRLW